jgi:cephalosporin-C deacetylase
MELQHDFPFDPSYGYTLAELRQVKPPPSEPEDFDRFWQRRYERAMAAAPRYEMNEIAPHAAGRRTFSIRFSTVDHPDLSGWIDLPADGVVERGLVMLHGYGGRPDGPDTGTYLDRCAVISPGLRGLAPSFSDTISADCWQHVVHGIEDRDSYVLGACVEDVWCATNVLQAAVPECADSLHLIGGSFGGGIGIMALAYDTRFRMAHVGVPTFGNHPLRVTLPCNGSGEAVRRRYQSNPEILEVLQYFDAATAAKRVHIPVLAAPALFDPGVPPPSQFATCNALAGPTALYIKKAGHFDHADTPTDNQAEFAYVRQWFAQGAEASITGETLAPSLRSIPHVN